MFVILHLWEAMHYFSVKKFCCRKNLVIIFVVSNFKIFMANLQSSFSLPSDPMATDNFTQNAYASYILMRACPKVPHSVVEQITV